MNASLTLMSASRIDRSVRRIAFEINEVLRGSTDVIFYGVDARGLNLAHRISALLKKHSGCSIECELLPVKDGGDSPAASEAQYAFIIDDVIFSGSTALIAFQKVQKLTRSQDIHLAVLIDRGHRKFPVEARFVGMKIPTKLDEHVSVMLEGLDGASADSVDLEAGRWLL